MISCSIKEINENLKENSQIFWHIVKIINSYLAIFLTISIRGGKARTSKLFKHEKIIDERRSIVIYKRILSAEWKLKYFKYTAAEYNLAMNWTTEDASSFYYQEEPFPVRLILELLSVSPCSGEFEMKTKPQNISSRKNNYERNNNTKIKKI